jgi:hypothetical protein
MCKFLLSSDFCVNILLHANDVQVAKELRMIHRCSPVPAKLLNAIFRLKLFSAIASAQAPW